MQYCRSFSGIFWTLHRRWVWVVNSVSASTRCWLQFQKTLNIKIHCKMTVIHLFERCASCTCNVLHSLKFFSLTSDISSSCWFFFTNWMKVIVLDESCVFTRKRHIGQSVGQIWPFIYLGCLSKQYRLHHHLICRYALGRCSFDQIGNLHFLPQRVPCCLVIWVDILHYQISRE